MALVAEEVVVAVVEEVAGVAVKSCVVKCINPCRLLQRAMWCLEIIRRSLKRSATLVLVQIQLGGLATILVYVSGRPSKIPSARCVYINNKIYLFNSLL